MTKLEIAPFLLATALCSADPAAGQMTEKYTFGSGVLSQPVDVAAYRECESGPNEYVFVADPGLGALVRYNGDGSTDITTASATNYLEQGPFGVAADDSLSSPRKGHVYVTDNNDTGTFGLVWIYKDTSLVDIPSDLTDGPTCMSITWQDGDGNDQILQEPRGIAVDLAGNLYVADRKQDVVVKVDAADFDHLGEVCIEVEASLVIESTWNVAIDVSVDKAGRIHIAHTCGCIPIYWPDGTLFGGAAIWVVDPPGVDAKNDHLNTISVPVDVAVAHDSDMVAETFSGAWTAGSFTDARGVEFQKYSRIVAGKRRCEDRLFVADAGAQEVVVLGEDSLSTPTPNGAVGFWRFDDPAPLDDSVGSNTIALSGIPLPEGVDGRVRCGLAFQNADGVVHDGRVVGSTDFDFDTGNFTIEGWICAESRVGICGVLDKRDGKDGFGVFLAGGHLGFQLMSDSVWENLSPSTPDNYIADGKWHHFAITVQRTLVSQARVRMFVDCMLTAEDTTPIMGSVTNLAPLIFGHENTVYDGLTGVLDEITIYDRELNVCEFNRICKAGCAGKHGPGDIHNFCVAEKTKKQCLPIMDAEGLPSLSANMGFNLVTKAVPADALGMLLYSLDGPGFLPFQDGVFCLQAPMRRTRLIRATGTGKCGGTLSFDMNAWFANGHDHIAPGTEVWAQYMIRDPRGGSSPPMLQEVPFVLTDAMHFTMLP